MKKITAADVNNLRKQTGEGMMDCKNALVESDGDFDKAIDVLRKKGQKVAAKRSDREAKEGVVLAKSNSKETKAYIVSLNCETDFVAKNESFIELCQDILDLAVEKTVENIQDLKSCLLIENMTVEQKLVEQTGVIGEKLELFIEIIESPQVVVYMHPGNRLATIVGFNLPSDESIRKDVAMQVAAMNPIAINKETVSKEIIDKEIEIGKDKAREEGKPEDMLEKIAFGRLNKFFKENTLLNQDFIKDNKLSVSSYLSNYNSDLTVLCYKRVGLGI